MLDRLIYVLSLHTPRKLLRSTIKPGTRCPIMMVVALLLGFSSQLSAAVITGKVTDSATGKALEGASLTFGGGNLGAAADSRGVYLFGDSPSGEWTLTASCIGYQTVTRVVQTSQQDTITLDFRLNQQSLVLDEVVTTATRTLKTLKNVPVATELVTRSDFQRRGSVNVAEALETEIGYDVQEDFSGQGVMLQGVDPDKVLILVDGNRVIGRVNGSIDLEQLSVGNVKQIEVVKGAVSTLYGSEAIGGVINIISEQPTPGLRLRFDMQNGGYFPDRTGLNGGSFSYSPGFFASRAHGKWGYSFGSRVTHVGLMDIDPKTPHTNGAPATSRINGDLKVSYQHTPSLGFTATTRGMAEEKNWVEDSGLLSISLAYDDYEVNRSAGFSVEGLYSPDPDTRESVKFYRTSNYHRWDKRTQPKWGSVRIEDFSKGEEDFTEYSVLMTRRPAAEHLFTMGGDVYQWNITSNSELGDSVYSPFTGNLTAWSGYVQDEWSIHPKFTFLPGVRYEHHEIYGGNFAPRLSLMYVPRDDIRIRASAGSGYRAPSAKELYYIFNHSAAGYIVHGNPDLSPERSINYSLNFEHNYQNSSVARLTLFYNNLRDLIDFYQVGISEQYYLGVFQYRNIYAAWVRGIELERNFRMTPHLEVKASYMFMQSHNGSTNGPLLRRPKHSGRWDVTYRHGVWTGKVWGRFTSKMMFTDIFETDEQSSQEWTNPYEIWNLSVAREWGRDWNIFTKVENLLDHTHGRYGPFEGRTVSIGANWSLNR